MENFIETLDEILAEKNLTPKELSKIIGVSHTTVGDWKNGALPTIISLFKLSDALGYSIDYLLRRSDNHQFVKTHNPSTFFERLNLLIDKPKSNPCQALRACHMRTSDYYDWKRGSLPMIDKIIVLANHFSCSVDFLLGRTDFK